MMSAGRKFFMLSVAVSVLGGGIVHGQEGSEGQTDGVEGKVVDQIVVTAFRREESVREIASNLAVFTGDQLEALGAKTFEDYLLTTPGVSINKIRPQESSIIIRGISTQAGQDSNIQTIQQPVGVYIDEVPFNDPLAFFSVPDLTPFDLERVEVLRGPQGTLYGSASLGGAIRFITKKPDLSDYQARLNLEGSHTDSGDLDWTAQGMVNLPIVSDKFAVRGVVSYVDNNGYADNLSTGEDNWNGYEQLSARGLARLALTEDIMITASVIHQQTDNFGSNTINLDLSGFSVFNANSIEENREYTIFNGVVDWDIGFADFMSSTTYGEKKVKIENLLSPQTAQNIARSNGRLIGTAFLMLPGALYDALIEPAIVVTGGFDGRDQSLDTWVQEVRLVSKDEGRFDWMIGGLYQKTESDLANQGQSINDLESVLNAAFFPIFMGGLDVGSLFTPGDFIFRTNDGAKNETKEWAIYGEVGFDITDDLKITAGGRYYNIDTTTNVNVIFLGNTFDTSILSDTDTLDDTGFNPRITLSYRPTDELLFYALVSKGFRVGGVNVQSLLNPLVMEPTTYESDSLWNYEGGVKAEWLDGRLITDLTLFYLDWSDIQLQGSFPIAGFVLNVQETRNGGAAHSFGIEGNFVARPTDALTFSTNFAYIDAKLDEDVPSFLDPFTGGPVLVPDGTQLPGSPKWQVANNVTYVFPVMDTGIDATIQLSHQYIGEYQANIASNMLPLGDYNKFDARISTDIDRFSIRLGVRNLTNKKGRSSAVIGNVGGVQEIRNIIVNPRTVSLSVTASF